MWLSPQVSALGLDPSGARLVTGGYDFDVKFWDFAGMDQALQAFRSLQPCEWWVHFWEKQRGVSTQLLNMWWISFIQTSSTLTAFMFAKVYTNTHTHICWASLSLMLTQWHPPLFIQNEPFRSRWSSYVGVCVSVYSVFHRFHQQRSNSFFWLWESVSWSRSRSLLISRNVCYN